MNSNIMGTAYAGREKRSRSVGTACIWPSGVQLRYDISAPTRWRWEKVGLLPRRDVFVGGKPVGWRPETLEAADRGRAA
jgi:hypothetical protein